MDTRASRVLLAVMVALGVGAALLASQGGARLSEFVGSASLPLPLLLPIVAVLATTGDWTHRSALTTYALVPHRQTVLGARVLAAIALVLATAFAITVLSVSAFLVLHWGDWTVFDGPALRVSIWSVFAFSLAAALSGVAMGSLLLNTPLAIVVTMVVPIAYDIAVTPRLPVVGEWFSSLGFSLWLTEPQWTWLSPTDELTGVGPALTSLVVWVCLPLLLGAVRQVRREVR
ncbi:hypothetical protein [Frondihabitans sp. PhB188]|uniref:hypothetical protein n=1 Tax=Frondihabitans sp. PhB188 TaxID=2485200 RepID=UPI0011CE7749|nr:hypothetical protein [Frondihabitans sp. PhB188]